MDHYFEQLSHCTPTSIPPLAPPGTPQGGPRGSQGDPGEELRSVFKGKVAQNNGLKNGFFQFLTCIVYQCTLAKFVSSACMFCIADECHQNDVKRSCNSWRLLPSPCINWQCVSGDKVSCLNSNIVHVCNYRKICCKISFLHFFIQEREVFFRDQHDRHRNPNHLHSLLQERVLC